MKRLAFSAAFLFIALPTLAQEIPPQRPASSPGDARIQSLEEQVRLLADQVAQLRAELRDMRDTKGAPSSGNKVVLASAQITPGMLPSAPEPIANSSPASAPAEPVSP